MFSPFAGLLFDPAAIPSVGDVTSPPYDVIDEPERQELLARSPYNVVRLLLADADDPSYTLAASLLSAWRRDGQLIADPAPRFYLYSMEYEHDGVRLEARGVLGALDVVDLGADVVPHEETMDHHKADRYSVLSATRANLDPIIGLSASPDLQDLLALEGQYRLDFTTPDGIRHRLRDITDPDRVEAITAAVGGHPVAIADGHHRYTTALAYRRAQEAAGGVVGGWTGIMTLIAAARGSGLTCGPYHRVFSEFVFEPTRIQSVFSIHPSSPEPPQHPGDIVIVTREGAHLLRPRPEALETLPEPWREASPAVARELLYPRLGVSEAEATYVAASAAATTGLAAHGAAVLVAPVSERAIALAGDAGIRFPQKSTYFVPKPRAGLVLRSFEG